MTLNLNATQHCSMCFAARSRNTGEARANRARVYLGGAGGLAVCPNHDLAGASVFWSDAIRRALGMDPPPFRDGPG